MRWPSIVAAVLLAVGSSLFAHQPVMDMVPRWAGGWGLQMFQEYRVAEDLFSGSDKIGNPSGLRREVHTTWLEGVYTFDRARRVTFKMPYVDQERVALVSGSPVTQRGHGLGDIMIAAPFKKYTNVPGLTYNWSATPQLRLPTGKTTHAFAVGDGSWDPGLSLSLSTESPRWYHLYDLWYWKNTQGSNGMRHGDELGFDINIGRALSHQEHNIGTFIMLDVTARWMDRSRHNSNSGGEYISMGPMFMVFKGNWAFRAEYRLPVYERWNGNQVGNEHRFSIGVGVAF